MINNKICRMQCMAGRGWAGTCYSPCWNTLSEILASASRNKMIAIHFLILVCDFSTLIFSFYFSKPWVAFLLSICLALCSKVRLYEATVISPSVQCHDAVIQRL